MNKFFNAVNAVSLKHQEIQAKFIDGISYMMTNYSLERNIWADGLEKLWNLKTSYEQQLEDCGEDIDRIKDVAVCFRCFDKKDGPCHDCD